jgi:glutamine amidotransferase
MHNGQISGFERLRRPMETMLDDELFNARSGTTDSELLFLLALQFGLRDTPIAAVAQTIAFVEGLAENILGSVLLRFTAAFSDGKSLYAVRYATDHKAPTLYASPLARGYCLVSEPLNDDGDAWQEIPDGSAVIVSADGLGITSFQPENRASARPEPVSIPA